MALFRKLKLLGDHATDVLCSDVSKLNLSRYIEEIASTMVEVKLTKGYLHADSPTLEDIEHEHVEIMFASTFHLHTRTGHTFLALCLSL